MCLPGKELGHGMELLGPPGARELAPFSTLKIEVQSGFSAKGNICISLLPI